MTAEVDRLAIFGGPPQFATELPVGQMYFSDWESYVREMKGIFERQYFTNHGPMTRELEEQLADFFGVRHVLCVTNATVGLIISLVAMSMTGKVITPAFTFIASAQALTWAGIEPIFCDIDPATGHLSIETIEPLLCDDVGGILAVNVWGGTCNPPDLDRFAQASGMPVLYDSAQAFGCGIQGTRVGSFGSAEVFSFHATKILNGGEGGCITTNDDELAARMRNIRSSYGAGSAVDVPITTNGRFSEAQAALARLSLSDFSKNQQLNQELWRRYVQRLANIPGISPITPSFVDESNWQCFSCTIDPNTFGLARDDLLRILKAEHINARRYFYPGCHRSIPYTSTLPQYRDELPNTDTLCRSVLQLPLGSFLTGDAVDAVTSTIETVQENADELSRRLFPRTETVRPS